MTRSEPQADALPPPQLEIEGGLERAPCALDNPQFADIRFTLRDVTFEGLKGATPEQLRPAYAELIGRENPVSVLCDIRDRAAMILRAAGYIASVEVPEQRIADGNVRFRVVMARLVQVRVRGDAGPAERTIAGYLEQLTGQEVFNRYQAERYLLLASDIPGYYVRLALRPAGTAPGEVVGDVTVQRYAGILDANVQNFGSRELGRWGGLLRAQLFGLTGLGDRTTATIFTTSDLEEQQTLQLGHDFRLGAEGVTVSGLLTYAWARPNIRGSDLDVDSRTFYATFDVGYPFVRRQARTLRGSLGMDFVNQDVEIDGDDFSRDRLRVAFVRLAADAVSLDFSRATLAEPLWRALGTLELRRGLDLFDASGDCGPAGADCDVPTSRLEADGRATVVRGSVYGEFRPARRLTLSLNMLAQYAREPLLTFEEFSGGNYTVGRGYDPGALIGDRGFGIQGEIRVGSLIPASGEALAAEPYLFLDYARVANEDRLIDYGRRNLSSFGGGVRAAWGAKMWFDLALAVPMEKVGPRDEKPDPRLLVSVTTRLWPWSFR